MTDQLTYKKPRLALKRSNTYKTNKWDANLDQDEQEDMLDIFNDDHEPLVAKQQKVSDDVVENPNKYVNYKETDSQIAENQSHIEDDIFDFRRLNIWISFPGNEAK